MGGCGVNNDGLGLNLRDGMELELYLFSLLSYFFFFKLTFIAAVSASSSFVLFACLMGMEGRRAFGRSSAREELRTLNSVERGNGCDYAGGDEFRCVLFFLDLFDHTHNRLHMQTFV